MMCIIIWTRVTISFCHIFTKFATVMNQYRCITNKVSMKINYLKVINRYRLCESFKLCTCYISC